MQFTRNRLMVLVSLFAAVLAAGVFVACGGDDDNTSGTPTAAGTTAAASGSPTSSAPSVEACPPTGAATSLSGAGATFPNPLYTDWFQRYADLCNVQVNYQSIGSGGGIQQITAKTVDFGASDGILTQEQFDAAPGDIAMIPMTADAVAIAFNLNGIEAGDITLDADTVAGIFLHDITKWNDPAITALNPGVDLPDEDITVVHRSDGSGTTYIFTNYLSKVSDAWKNGPGNATSVEWPTGVGGQGNEGVAGQVQQLPGAIGYVSLGYVRANNIKYTLLKNSSDNAIEPTIETAAIAANGVTLPDNMQVMITNTDDPQGYPISGFTWLLLYKEQEDKAKAMTIAHMVHWMLTDAQQYAPALDYVALSDKAVEKALAELDTITYNGTPILDLQ
jgi:phosphate transport system substrate-binding protein